MITSDERPTVLICLQHYLPGFKAGGPIRSVRAIVEKLGEEFKFKIITYDRDFGDDRPFPNIEPNKWVESEFADICYIPKTQFGWLAMIRLLRSTEADLLYLQSLTHPVFTFLPSIMYRLRLMQCRHLLIAPRGELSPGALSIRPIKKKAYIAVTRGLRLFSRGRWHASSDLEARQISAAYSSRMKNTPLLISVAAALLPTSNKAGDIVNSMVTSHLSTSGCLRLLFVARICPMKNLDFAIRMLSKCKKRICFSIYGPVDRDNDYWNKCRVLLSELPQNVTATYMGQVAPEKLPEIYGSHDLLLLPTKGENFGHVIAESLQHGCPVMISDQTPWQELSQYGAGWVFPLDDMHSFSKTIDEVAGWEISRLSKLRRRAMDYAATRLNSKEVVQRTREMLSLSCLG